MKTNYPLQTSIRFENPGQKVWYAAHVLKAAVRNCPTAIVKDLVPAIKGSPAIIAQTAKAARPQSLAVPASANITGYAFGELYLNSPAYPIGTAIPAIPAKPASLAVIGKSAVVATPGSPAIYSPQVVAIPGWEDAIQIIKSQTELKVIFQLPVLTGLGIVGSVKTVIGEISPSNLQANGWFSEISYNLDPTNIDTILYPTLEEYLYKHALDCDNTVTDTSRIVNGINIPCKTVEVNLYHSSTFNPDNVDIQLSKIRHINLNLGS
jgi:hypothetical protein